MKAEDEDRATGYPDYISYETSEKILEQMLKNICKIKIQEKKQGTGFFCKIPFPDKNEMIPVFITNNHIIKEELLNKEGAKIDIYIKEEKELKTLNFSDRMKYTNKEYDVTIIELKEKDNINNYLKLDNKIINDIINNDNNNNHEYIDETIYIIQYPKGKLSVSSGVLGVIFENKKYGWLFFYSQLTDISVLYHLDWLIDILCKRYNVKKDGIKRFVRTYHEIRNNQHESKYLFNADKYNDLDKRLLLAETYKVSVDKLKGSEEEIDKKFRRFLFKDLSSLEKDIQNFS